MSDEIGAPETSDAEQAEATPPAKKPASFPRRLVAAVAAVALVGGGVGAAVALSSSSGGSSSPTGAVDALLTAADHSDLLGMLDALVPGERQVIEPALVALVHQLERLGILSGGTNLSSVSGVALHFSGVTTRTVAITPSLAAVTPVTGKVSDAVDPAKLPVARFVTGVIGSRLLQKTTIHTSSAAAGGTPIVAEKVGGGWYVSVGYTIAVDALVAKSVHRGSAPLVSAGSGGIVKIPAVPIAPKPSTTADDAVRAFLDDGASFDLRSLIAVLAPGEMGALQTFAPDFIGRAQAALARARSEFHLAITSVRFADSTVNGATLVQVSDVGLKISAHGITISIKNGCLSETTASGTTPTRCPKSASRSGEEQRILAILPATLRSSAARLFTAHPQIGIAAVNENGGW